MTPEQLRRKLDELLRNWEDECVEFKSASEDVKTSEIGEYFSALSNEANLKGRDAGWLVFGVDNKTRKVIGTAYREAHEHLQDLKRQIAQSTDPSVTFREIHELSADGKRVLMFEIPPAPRGIPIGWNGHYHSRNHESLGALNLAKLDEIRSQAGREDWSITVCPRASLSDLDSDAVRTAREKYIEKYGGSIPEATIRGWDEATFLDRARITINGAITRTALLLLGKPESTHHLSPFVGELSWKLEGKERAYEIFHPPFLLTSSLLYRRIRNIPLTILPPGTLLPLEISKYEQKVIREALHNCIAHQDYTRAERVVVIERADELEFTNAGSFYEGSPEDYILRNRTPKHYRNAFLASAMVNVKMIDTQGFGIRDVMFREQARRYLPLPDYDLSDPGHVVLHLPGQFIDENYSRALIAHSDFTLDEIFALDRIQKSAVPDGAALMSLRKRGLVEGRRPALHIAAAVAAITGRKAEYFHARGQDDAFLEKSVLDYLDKFSHANRTDLDKLLRKYLPDGLTEAQAGTKIHNLLSRLRRRGDIKNHGTRNAPDWRRAGPGGKSKKSRV